MDKKLWDLLIGRFYRKRYVLKLLPSLGIAIFYAMRLTAIGTGTAVSGFCAMFCLIYTFFSLYGVALSASEIVYGYSRYFYAVIGLLGGCFLVGALESILSLVLPLNSIRSSGNALDIAIFPVAIFLILRDILRFAWSVARSKSQP